MPRKSTQLPRRAATANVVDLAQARSRLRPTPTAASAGETQAARNERLVREASLHWTDEAILRRRAVAIGRSQLGGSPFIGTVEQEEALLRRMQVMVARLKRRAGRVP